nr:non-specific lipid-transfer protein 2 [Ipomoea batatas]
MTVAVLLLLLGEAQFSLATCDAKQLNPCLSALTFNLHPPPQCCERLNQQKPCFCQYVKNPKLKDYLVNSAAAKKVYELCKAFNFMTLAVLLLLLGETQFSLATCDAKQLNPCLSALTFNLHPPPQCCERLNQQKPCFCQYVKNPKLKDYLVNSAAAKKVYELCKVTMPNCSIASLGRSKFSLATCDAKQLNPWCSPPSGDSSDGLQLLHLRASIKVVGRWRRDERWRGATRKDRRGDSDNREAEENGAFIDGRRGDGEAEENGAPHDEDVVRHPFAIAFSQ